MAQIRPDLARLERHHDLHHGPLVFAETRHPGGRQLLCPAPPKPAAPV